MKVLKLLMWLACSTALAQTPVESILTEDTIRILRDPFEAPTQVVQSKETKKSDLEMYSLKDFKLKGIIMGGRKQKAIVGLPNSKSYFISVGDKVGLREGKVVSIHEDSIQVMEFDYGENGKKIPETIQLMLSGEMMSLKSKEKL